ncbi:hypothetical protein ABK040_013870 [Willaertia magna]
MRNLHLLHQHKITLDNLLKENDEVVASTCIDNETLFGITKNGFLFEISQGSIQRTINLNEIEGITPNTEMLDIQYVVELESLIIISQIDIITYNLSNDHSEITASIEEGIYAMSWSPDQEIVLFATGNGNLLVMSKHFENLAESPIDSIPTTLNISTVGIKNQKPLPEDVQERFINKKLPVHISWRSDGQYFVVNSMDEDGKRWLRVWERNGNLISKSEQLDGVLGNVVHYRPDGSIIGTHYYHPGKKETFVLFFERNGLQHYDFLLEKGMSDVYSLEWNNSSDVLCVTFKSSITNNYHVQLWYRGNYHWYLKQEYIFNENEKPTSVLWDSELSYRLHVYCRDGTYIKYDLCWDHDISKGYTSENPCLTAVINGKSLNLTPLRYAVVPPPLCSDALVFDSAVNSVSFDNSNRFLVQLSDGSIHLFKYNLSTKPPKFGLPPEKIGTIKLENNESRRLITLINENTFCYVPFTLKGSSLCICNIKEDFSCNVTEVSYPEEIIRVEYHSYTGNLFVQGETGALFKMKLTDDIPEELSERFEHPCHWMIPTMLGEEEVVVGLSQKGVLYINSHNVVSNCSSIAVTDQFLLFTTLSHKLRIINLHLSVYDAVDIASSGPSSKYDETFRDLERGARLVCAIPSDLNVILQMPRGNLEGITPKALVLSRIRSLLNGLEYSKAVVATRKYRIDMNLIYDHNPQQFLTNVKRFVEDVNNADYINLFLSTLVNEDVTKNKFSGYHTEGKIIHDEEKPQPVAGTESKINNICNAVREALNGVDKSKFISSILTTYAKHDPPQLDEALSLIREIRNAGQKAESEAALSYLVFLVDVNTLYNIALGMYDFDLVLMVAQKSQKDPKEYLPFIANLKKLEQYYRQYKIDMYLERYEKALENISKAGDEHFDEAIKLIRDKGLFKLGLQLYKSNASKSIIVFEAYGDYLFETKSYHQAAFAYLEAKKYEKAQQAFIESANYQFVFSLTKTLNQSPQDIKKIARTMVNILEREKKIVEASIVCREYLNDTEESILKLVSGHEWQEALRVAVSFNRNDLIETHIKPGVFDYLRLMKEELSENETKLQKYVTRLIELREEKEKQLREQLLLQQHNEGEFGEDMPHNIDALSESSSIQSGMSNYSGVSILSARSTTSSVLSKRQVSRKKKNREKLRKGSPFEELNLVSRIESLIPNKGFILAISNLQQVLIHFGNFEDAKHLQISLERVLNYCKEHAATIEEPFSPPQVENEPTPAVKYPKKVQDITGDTTKWKLNILISE